MGSFKPPICPDDCNFYLLVQIVKESWVGRIEDFPPWTNSSDRSTAGVANVDEAIDLAVAAEGGRRHTATMHSRNIDKLSRMARLVNCSIFVKNGPCYAGLGEGGEGFCSFSIATPTGEGLTRPRRRVGTPNAIAPVATEADLRNERRLPDGGFRVLTMGLIIPPRRGSASDACRTA